MTRLASLLASAICVSVALAPVPALALFGIGDVVFDPSVFAQTLATAEELARQIEVMRQQYNQLVQTYQAIAHLPDTVLQSLAAQLNTQQFRSPITTDPAAVVSAIAGLQLGDAGASARQYWQRNNVYTAPGQDFLANQLAMRGNSVAAVQGLVNDLYASATQHAQALQGLESELNSAPGWQGRPGYWGAHPNGAGASSSPPDPGANAHRLSGRAATERGHPTRPAPPLPV